MKPHRDASELAARLGAAASKPVPLPTHLAIVPPASAPATAEPAEPIEAPKPAAAKRPKERASKSGVDTVAITLRPDRALLTRYTLAAAERTRKLGRVVSAQEVMMEILEREL